METKAFCVRGGYYREGVKSLGFDLSPSITSGSYTGRMARLVGGEACFVPSGVKAFGGEVLRAGTAKSVIQEGTIESYSNEHCG